ncbi:hypothetical protein XELAEV_18011182mg [Xenopus laevis]|uniref:Uncharacterized protein n=1 Tax=Xenopus laevis TaxID=8355 RepID=A0A974DKA5_XENLA|nr:hypothetical protein XELAEV_18011182mg [Xenopus laevis]
MLVGGFEMVGFRGDLWVNCGNGREVCAKGVGKVCEGGEPVDMSPRGWSEVGVREEWPGPKSYVVGRITCPTDFPHVYVLRINLLLQFNSPLSQEPTWHFVTPPCLFTTYCATAEPWASSIRHMTAVWPISTLLFSCVTSLPASVLSVTVQSFQVNRMKKNPSVLKPPLKNV